jgi:formylglycine-generating enzyme required for sulfatase activity
MAERDVDAELAMAEEAFINEFDTAASPPVRPLFLPVWEPINPFNDDQPIHFVGREDFVRRVQSFLAEAPATPVLVHGDTHIGKSTFLRQMAHHHFLGQSFMGLLLEGRKLIGRPEPWLWVLDRLLVAQLKAEGLTMPAKSQNSFMTDPSAVLRTKVLDVGFKNLPAEHHLVLFIDDVDVLMGQRDGRAFLETITRLTRDYPRLHTVWSSTAAPQALQEQLPDLAFNQLKLISLSSSETTQYLRYFMPMYIFNEVEEYLFNLTHGHPYYLRHLCRLLYDYGRQYAIRQISLADVVTVSRSEEYLALQPVYDTGEVRGYLWYDRQRTQVIANRSLEGDFAFSTAPSSRNPLIWAIPIVLVLCVGAGLIWQWWPTLAGGQEAMPTAVAVVVEEPTAEPTATPTATPSPTAEPSPTPTPAETATPVVVIITATAEPSTPTAEPTAEPVVELTPDGLPKLLIREKDEMPLLLIEGDYYLRGSDEDVPRADFDERPVREVFIADFYMDQYLVSVTQYAAFLNDLGNHTAACGNIDCARTTIEASDTFLIYDGTTYYPRRSFEVHPINNISWFGARDYCRWVGGRLPSEAEWEYAARGTDGRLYPWGNEPPNPARAIYATTFSSLLPVDALPDGASFFGVYQMAGTLWEWTNDWYAEDYYDWGPTTNPPGPPQGEGRVVRGSAWTPDSTAERIRSANRNWFRPTALRADIGFRCAYDVVVEQ